MAPRYVRQTGGARVTPAVGPDAGVVAIYAGRRGPLRKRVVRVSWAARPLNSSVSCPLIWERCNPRLPSRSRDEVPSTFVAARRRAPAWPAQCLQCVHQVR